MARSMGTMHSLAEAMPGLRERLAAIRETARRQAIERHGWPDTINCPSCGDTGTLPGTGAAGPPRFCGCEVGQERETLHRRAVAWDGLVPRRVRDYRLDTAPDAAATARVREWLAGDPWDTGRNLVLMGAPGTGKTGLAVAALHVAHMAGRRVCAVNVVEWLDLMRPSGDPARQRLAEDTLRRAERATVLLLDDLGADKPSDWVRERVYAIVDHRHNRLVPTVVTTNLPRADLGAAYGERTIDRLFQSSANVAMGGANLRRVAR